MPDNENRLEELTHFIRKHRSNESHFEKLYETLVAEKDYAQNGSNQSYADALHEIIEKHAAPYKQKKEKGIEAWSEFENFVSHFEVAVTKASDKN